MEHQRNRKRRESKNHFKKGNEKDKKKRRKEHRRGRERHSCSTGSSSSSSSETNRNHAVRTPVLSQLEKDKAAVQAARYILARQPGVRKPFRELLWELDNGRAAGVSGIPDSVLRAQLQFTFEHLGLKCTKGQYWLPSTAPSTLSVIGFVFEEPSSQRTPVPPQGMLVEQTGSGSTATEQQPDAAPAAAADPVHNPLVTGPELPTGWQQDIAQPQQQPPQQQQDGRAENRPDEPQQLSTGRDADCHHKPAAPLRPEPRRAVGPAAPSPELLAAAAAYHAEVEAAGGYEAASLPGPPGDAGSVIGPPPPDFVAEAAAAPADAREAAVMRVLRVLRQAEGAHPRRNTGAAGPSPIASAAGVAADPYAVLDVDPSSDAGTIRKSYWRLSLLVHPDKCNNPAAQEVFQAVSQAAQLLQDVGQRKQLDEQKADAALRQQALATAERQVAWHKARGGAVPADLAAAVAAGRSAGGGPATRDSWMTDLPTNQGKAAAQALAMGLSQTNQTSFSRFGVQRPGDTSNWTDTPQQRAVRAAGLLTNSSTASRPAQTAPTAAVEGTLVSAELAAAMSEYSGRCRQRSLLEQHAEQQGQHKQQKPTDKKQREKAKEPGKDGKGGKGQKRKAEGGQADGEWAGKHPWKPWDRDKHLEVQLQRPRAATDLLKAAGNLSSRFSSGK